MWGGLLVRGELSIPAAYTTGTITVTRGSKLVTGTGTSWSYQDIATHLTNAILYPGEYQDITPDSMTGINAGDWLNISDGAADQEYLLVLSVTSSSFQAKPTVAHAAHSTIYKSILSRRQFRLGTTRPFYNIIGVSADQHLTLDLPWGHNSQSLSAYQICQAYVTLEQNLRMVWSVLNTAQGWRLRLNMPQEVLNTYDAWRQTTGWVYMMVDYIPDEIGRMQYELYPTPSMEQGFPYLAYRTIPNLAEDEDTPPPCIPSHLLVHGALADVMIHNRKSAYYDPNVAAGFLQQFLSDLEWAVFADDSVYMQNLQWAYSRYPFTQHGANYWQSHDIDSTLGSV
jgi:hypothetical protein